MLLLVYLGTRGVSSKGSLLFVLLAAFFWITIAPRRIIEGRVTRGCHASRRFLDRLPEA